jgi:transcriptional regulator with XRE-family HTH domain
MPDPQESVRARLRRLRIERGLTQSDLAAAAGVSPGQLSRVESGSRRATVPFLRKAARALRVSASYLETGAALPEDASRDLRLTDAELELRLATDGGQAEATFRALLAEAVEAGDADAELRARIGLGLAAAHHGAYADVVARLERAVDDPRVTPQTHPDVYASLGHAYVETSVADRAIALFRGALELLDAAGPDLAPAFVRFSVYLSAALADAGAYDEAQQVIDEAVKRAELPAPDPYTRVRLEWSQARLASARGDTSLAATSIRRAIALLQTTEDTLHLARAHLFAGEIALGGGRLDEAAEQLARTELTYAGTLDTQDRAWLRSEQAKLAARRGDGSSAELLAREALALAADDPPERGRAEWALAEALASSDRLDEASQAFDRAAELLAPEGRYIPDLLLARARALRLAGRVDAAARYELRARRLRQERVPAPTSARGPRKETGQRARRS